MTTLFLSYARGDDELFVKRLHADLTACGFAVWFDGVSMPSRTLTFHQEIRDAIAARERLVLVVGPKAVTSEYVRQEWQFAWFEADKVVTPILRLGDYPLAIPELALLHAEDFRNDAVYELHLKELVRMLREPAPPLGKLIAVPSLPAHFLSRSEGLTKIREALRADLDRPVVIGGAAARVGMHGMGGIGKSVLAAALARDRRVREAFPDGIVWVGLGSLRDVRALMQRVHRDLGGDGAIATEHEGKHRLRELLADKAVLLVLDDAWRRSDVDAFEVLGSRCRALVTTRDAGLLPGQRGVHHLVELFTDAEALRLLAVSAGVESSVLPTEAREVLGECGRLPLAIALAGGMNSAGTPWRDLRDALREHELEFLEDPQSANEHHVNLWRMIEVSVSALSDDLQQRFVELAVFPQGEQIPEAAVITLWRHTGSLSERNARQLLRHVKQRSLVFLNQSGTEEPVFVALHDLLHDFAVRIARKPDSTLTHLHQAVLEAYQSKCPSGWPSGPNDGYFFRHLRDHLVATARLHELAELLVTLDWLEAKARNGLADDLKLDFSAILDNSPQVNNFVVERTVLLQLAKFVTRHQWQFHRDPDSISSQFSVDFHGTDATLDYVENAWQQRVEDRGGICLRRTNPASRERQLVSRLELPYQARTAAIACFPAQGCAVFASQVGDLVVVDPDRSSVLRHRQLETGRLYAVSAASSDLIAVLVEESPQLRVYSLPKLDEVSVFCLDHVAEPRWVTTSSADGLLAIGGRDSLVLLTINGHEVLSAKYPLRKKFPVPYCTNMLAFDGSGRFLAAACRSGDILIFDKSVRTFLDKKGYCGQAALSLAFESNRPILWAGSFEGKLLRWDLESGSISYWTDAETDPVESLLWLEQGSVLVSGHRSGSLRVWSSASRSPLAHITLGPKWITALAQTQGSDALLAADDAVSLPARADELMALKLEETRSIAAEIMPAVSHVVTAGLDGTVRHFALDNTGIAAITPISEFLLGVSVGGYEENLKPLEIAQKLAPWERRNHAFPSALATDFSGRLLFVGCSDGSLVGFQMESQTLLLHLVTSEFPVTGIAVSSDRRRLGFVAGDAVYCYESGDSVREIRAHKFPHMLRSFPLISFLDADHFLLDSGRAGRPQSFGECILGVWRFSDLTCISELRLNGLGAVIMPSIERNCIFVAEGDERWIERRQSQITGDIETGIMRMTLPQRGNYRVWRIPICCRESTWMFTGTPAEFCAGHKAVPVGLAIDESEAILVTLDYDGRLRVWDLDDASCVHEIRLGSRGLSGPLALGPAKFLCIDTGHGNPNGPETYHLQFLRTQ